MQEKLEHYNSNNFASASSDKGRPLQKNEEITISKKSHLAVLCIERTTIGCYDFVQIDFNQLERILPNGKISIFKVILLVQTMQVFLKLIFS
jgi:hypothetical protein